MPLRAGSVRSIAFSRAAAWQGVLPGLAVLACGVGMAGLVLPGLVPVDGLSAVFLVALGLAGSAEGDALAAVRLGAGLVCVGAPDAFVLVLGFELACVVSGRSVFGAAPLLLAAVLVGASGPFDAVRAGTPAVALLALALAGVARSAVAGGAVVPVTGVYVLARFLQLCGSGTPAWWGFVLLGSGTVLAGVAGWRAIGAGTLAGVGMRLFQAGLGAGVASLGAEVAARGSDLPDVAGAAGAGFLLMVLVQAGGLAVFGAAARAVAAGAGTERLGRLGGLAGSMPRSSVALGVGAWSLAMLPPSAGFAGAWLACQAGFGLVRSGGVLAVVLVLCAAGGGVAAGCCAAAAVRVLAVACLGRPRLPRSSAAQDAGGVWGWVLPRMAGLLVVAGVGAGVLVAGLAGPVRLLSGGPVPMMPWFDAEALAWLAAVAVPMAWLSRGRRTMAPWNDGRGPPPPWLPFGDPAEQWSAGSFAAPFRVPRLPFPWRAHLPMVSFGPRRGAARLGPGWQAVLFAVLFGVAVFALRR